MKTIEVTPVNSEAEAVDVKHEAIDFKNASTKLRREMAVTVFGAIANNLSDEDLEKYDGISDDINERYKAKLGETLESIADATETTGEKLELHDAPVPADSADYNYEELAAQAEEDNKLLPLRQQTAKRLGFSWTKGAGVYANLAIFKTALDERREARLQDKLQGKAIAEQLQFLEDESKKWARRKKLASWAIAGVATAMTFKGLATGLESMFQVDTPDLDSLRGMGQKAGTVHHAVALMNDEKPLPQKGIDVAIMEKYNNSDSSFYDFAHKAHRGDFGPALQASAKDGNFGPGFADWMSRNQHEPNGLANLVSGLKLDGRGDSLADRNALADVYDNDKMAQIKADILVQNELRDPTKFSVETIKVDFPYKTTYMVDVNGDPVISMQEYTDHGGEAFKIINKLTGEVTYWRKDCGAYQQIWPLERAHQTYASTYTARGGSSNHYQSTPAPRPTHPNTPSNPGTPRVPGTPGTKVPNIPDVPPIPGTPVETDEAKDYSGGVDTAPGIDPSRNTFQGWTPDPAESGNGTGSQNLAPQVAPNSESAQQAPGAAPNSEPQVANQEAGAGTNRTSDDFQKFIQGAQDFIKQATANKSAGDMDSKMSSNGAVDDAVRKAQSGMGADGRPLK